MKRMKLLFFIIVLFSAAVTLFVGCGHQESLEIITVTPSNPSIVQGSTQQFFATGIYSDDSVADLTSSVTWSSSNSLVATISNSTGSQGIATALATGSTTISATDPATNISGFTTLSVN